MMVSAYRLEPYSDAYLDNVLDDLGRQHVAGLVFSSLGAISAFLQQRGFGYDEIALNRRIFSQAQVRGAEIWLQPRVYDNQLLIRGEAAPRNVNAEELLANPAATAAYRERLHQEVAAYNDYFADACVVILFEEAGIYHAAAGGGSFWSSEPSQISHPSEHYDRLFAERFSGLFREGRREIKAINPRCSVGIHLGHSVFEDKPVLEQAFAALRKQGEQPDFVFYDLSLKAQPDFEHYADRLRERADFIEKVLQLPAMHLVQLNTMNNFQHGLGATPSQAEIDRMIQLDRDLGFSGVGFYTKNAVPTSSFDNNPLAPNRVGQATVYESSRDRWDYGMLKLAEAAGVDFAGRFDLVVRRAAAAPPMTIEALESGSGQWRPLGSFPGPGKVGQPEPQVSVLRTLDASRWLQDRRELRLRLHGAGAADENMGFWIIPAEPSASFRSAQALQAELDKSGGLAGARASIVVRGSQAEFSLCTK